MVAEALIAQVQGSEAPAVYTGAGSCYVEFGAEQVGRVDVDFLSGPAPTGGFLGLSLELAGEKQDFGSSRRRRWFGVE